MSGIEHSSIHIELKRFDRVYRPGDLIEGTLMIIVRDGWSHQGIQLQILGSLPLFLLVHYTHTSIACALLSLSLSLYRWGLHSKDEVLHRWSADGLFRGSGLVTSFFFSLTLLHTLSFFLSPSSEQSSSTASTSWTKADCLRASPKSPFPSLWKRLERVSSRPTTECPFPWLTD